MQFTAAQVAEIESAFEHVFEVAFFSGIFAGFLLGALVVLLLGLSQLSTTPTTLKKPVKT